MKLNSKKKSKVLAVFISLIMIFVGVSVITGTPPFVFMNDEPYFTFTKDLSLNYKDFSNEDVNALKHMRWVKKISLNGTKITDTSFLDKMDNLETVFFVCDPEYQIQNLTSLKNCKKLKYFFGINLDITNLSAFKEQKNLIVLQIPSSNINDISDVKYLVNAREIWISGNDITDISALNECTKLTTLSIFGTNCDVYPVLITMPALEWLKIDKGVLTSIQIKELERKGVSVYEREF